MSVEQLQVYGTKNCGVCYADKPEEDFVPFSSCSHEVCCDCRKSMREPEDSGLTYLGLPAIKPCGHINVLLHFNIRCPFCRTLEKTPLFVSEKHVLYNAFRRTIALKVDDLFQHLRLMYTCTGYDCRHGRTKTQQKCLFRSCSKPACKKCKVCDEHYQYLCLIHLSDEQIRARCVYDHRLDSVGQTRPLGVRRSGYDFYPNCNFVFCPIEECIEAISKRNPRLKRVDRPPTPLLTLTDEEIQELLQIPTFSPI